MGVALVIENDPAEPADRLGEWLTEAGLELTTVRPYADEALPEALDGYAALVVLGGGQHAYPAEGGEPGAAWFPAAEKLLRRAVRHRVPTLGIGLGAHLLAAAHGGGVAPAAGGPATGPALVARRDAAEADPLFARVPFTPDVIWWHADEITELPIGAVPLAAATRGAAPAAYRLGPAAWGLQFHIEAGPETVAGWARHDPRRLARLGWEPEGLVAAVAEVQEEIAEAWQPFAARFAALARGELDGARPALPLLGDGPAGGAAPAGDR